MEAITVGSHVIYTGADRHIGATSQQSYDMKPGMLGIVKSFDPRASYVGVKFVFDKSDNIRNRYFIEYFVVNRSEIKLAPSKYQVHDGLTVFIEDQVYITAIGPLKGAVIFRRCTDEIGTENLLAIKLQQWPLHHCENLSQEYLMNLSKDIIRLNHENRSAPTELVLPKEVSLLLPNAEEITSLFDSALSSKRDEINDKSKTIELNELKDHIDTEYKQLRAKIEAEYKQKQEALTCLNRVINSINKKKYGEITIELANEIRTIMKANPDFYKYLKISDMAAPTQFYLACIIMEDGGRVPSIYGFNREVNNIVTSTCSRFHMADLLGISRDIIGNVGNPEDEKNWRESKLEAIDETYSDYLLYCLLRLDRLPKTMTTFSLSNIDLKIAESFYKDCK
eukprot:Pompholyxophrys_sp_v1_NODE_1_length_32789_cov_6.460653.p9 type:complete len:395 gc:universal NODE_1_length_32789_cov_6.460653:29291-28107(-)